MALDVKGKTYVTTKEAAQLIDSSYNTVKTRNKDWGWSRWKMGRKTYFDRQEVLDWLSEKIQLAS